MSRSTIFIIFLALIIGCRHNEIQVIHPLNHVEDPEVKRILSNAWDQLGGWDNYQLLDSIVYEKRSILYLKDSVIESETLQTHTLSLKPQLSGRLAQNDDGRVTEIVLDDSGFYKAVDGARVIGSEKAARSSFLSAHYVLFAPFKLIDPGTSLKMMPSQEINGHKVDVIRATWNPQKFDNHSTDDTWYFHFDKETGQFLSYLVYHAPTYAMVHNVESTIHKGFNMPVYRETWRVDSLGNREYLRGQFWYGY